MLLLLTQINDEDVFVRLIEMNVICTITTPKQRGTANIRHVRIQHCTRTVPITKRRRCRKPTLALNTLRKSLIYVFFFSFFFSSFFRFERSELFGWMQSD